MSKETVPTTNNTKSAEPPKRERQSLESTFAEKWTPETIGDSLEGEYLGYDEAPGRGGDTFRAHQLKGADGKRWSLAGAHLDSFLPQVPRGAYVWVTYKGTQRMKNGEMQLFAVDVEKGVKLINTMK